jgi:hypothetical protein
LGNTSEVYGVKCEECGLELSLVNPIMTPVLKPRCPAGQLTSHSLYSDFFVVVFLFLVSLLHSKGSTIYRQYSTTAPSLPLALIYAIERFEYAGLLKRNKIADSD